MVIRFCPVLTLRELGVADVLLSYNTPSSPAADIFSITRLGGLSTDGGRFLKSWLTWSIIH